MMPREKWTDERLDDLSKKVEDGFAGTKAEIADTKGELKAEIADTRAEMRHGFDRVDTETRELRREMNARFDAMNRNMFAGVIAVVAAVIGSNAL